MSTPEGEAVCTCRSRKGFGQDFDMLPIEWFVCSECGKPTRLYLERQFTDAMMVEVDDGPVVDVL